MAVKFARFIYRIRLVEHYWNRESVERPNRHDDTSVSRSRRYRIRAKQSLTQFVRHLNNIQFYFELEKTAVKTRECWNVVHSGDEALEKTDWLERSKNCQ